MARKFLLVKLFQPMKDSAGPAPWALAFSTLTVVIWWTVLTPLITALIGDKQKQDKFKEFNSSSLLLNIHGVNLPIAAIEFYLSSSKFVFFDLWIALLICFSYMIFYLFVLDARGIHLYIIFTPRTHYCFLIYSLALSIFYLCYIGWNNIFI